MMSRSNAALTIFRFLARTTERSQSGSAAVALALQRNSRCRADQGSPSSSCLFSNYFLISSNGCCVCARYARLIAARALRAASHLENVPHAASLATSSVCEGKVFEPCRVRLLWCPEISSLISLAACSGSIERFFVSCYCHRRSSPTTRSEYLLQENERMEGLLQTTLHFRSVMLSELFDSSRIILCT